MSFLNPRTVADGESLNIGKLFNVQYLIPDYQRDFAWSEKQINQLWNDLIEHYKKVAPSDDLTNPQGYFLGAMVAIQEGSNSDWEVVDGQQRLTTLSIIVVIMCEILEKYSKKLPLAHALILGLNNCFKTYHAGGLRPWMSYSDQDTNNAFRKFCIETNSRKERDEVWFALPTKFRKKTSPYFVLNRAFIVGYIQVLKFIKNAGFANRGKRAIAFAQMVLDCLVILRIKAGSYEGAYAIFESLNDRGLRLSQADLVKNELLKVSSTTDRDEVVEYWTNTKQLLSDTPLVMSELLHYSCLHRYGLSKAQGLFAFVKGLLQGGQNPKVIAAGLEEDAHALEQLIVLRPLAWTHKTSQMLDDITKIISVKFSYPMLMALHKKLSASKDDFEKSMKLVMNFLYRFMTVSEGAPERLCWVASEVGRICRDPNLNNHQAMAEISKLFVRESPNDVFAKEFSEFAVANTKLAYFSVYYLEAHMLRGTMPLTHGMESILEHIMPKTPTPKEWPNVASMKHADPGAYNELIWRIGNLLPLPEDINKSIKNKSIAYKISGGTKNYSSSHLVSPNSLRKFMDASQEWDEAAIIKRQLYLATIAPEVWSVTL